MNLIRLLPLKIKPYNSVTFSSFKTYQQLEFYEITVWNLKDNIKSVLQKTKLLAKRHFKVW